MYNSASLCRRTSKCRVCADLLLLVLPSAYNLAPRIPRDEICWLKLRLLLVCCLVAVCESCVVILQKWSYITLVILQCIGCQQAVYLLHLPKSTRIEWLSSAFPGETKHSDFTMYTPRRTVVSSNWATRCSLCKICIRVLKTRSRQSGGRSLMCWRWWPAGGSVFKVYSEFLCIWMTLEPCLGASIKHR
jgi:hypothetical protein